MYDRNPPARVPLVYVTPCGKGCANSFNPVLFVSDGMPFVNSLDYRRPRLGGCYHCAEDDNSGARAEADCATHTRHNPKTNGLSSTPCVVPPAGKDNVITPVLCWILWHPQNARPSTFASSRKCAN